MSELHHYRAFGLSITSDHLISTLKPVSDSSADVRIERVAPGTILNEDSFPNNFANWRAGPDRFLLEVEGIADFLVENGSSIRLRPRMGAADEVISAFLTGSAFSALLQQRRFLTIHSSAVISDAGAVLFVGRSGVGKSTTLAAMAQRGYEMVTDDVAAIDFDDEGTPRITPSFEGGRVTGAALDWIGHSRDAFTRLTGEIEKYLLPLEMTSQSRPAIGLIVVLDVWPESTICPDRISTGEAFQLLSQFSFRKRFYDGMGMQGFHFESVSKLVNRVPVVRISRPDEPLLLNQLVEKIEAQICAFAPSTT